MLCILNDVLAHSTRPFSTIQPSNHSTMADHSLSLKRGRKGASLTGGVALGGRGCANTLTTTVCLHLQVGAQRGSVWPCYRCDSCLNGHVYACSQKQDPTSGSKTKHKEPKRSSKKRSLSNNDHSCKVCAKRWSQFDLKRFLTLLET